MAPARWVAAADQATRAAAAAPSRSRGLPSRIPLGITTHLENGGPLERAQQMAGHSSPRTTKLYDRTRDEVTLDEVERIVL